MTAPSIGPRPEMPIKNEKTKGPQRKPEADSSSRTANEIQILKDKLTAELNKQFPTKEVMVSFWHNPYSPKALLTVSFKSTGTLENIPFSLDTARTVDETSRKFGAKSSNYEPDGGYIVATNIGIKAGDFNKVSQKIQNVEIKETTEMFKRSFDGEKLFNLLTGNIKVSDDMEDPPPFGK